MIKQEKKKSFLDSAQTGKKFVSISKMDEKHTGSREAQFPDELLRLHIIITTDFLGNSRTPRASAILFEDRVFTSCVLSNTQHTHLYGRKATHKLSPRMRLVNL
jgi:hypothetical protein